MHCFHRCVSVHMGGGGVTASPSHNTSTGHMTFPGGGGKSILSPSHNTSTGPMSFLEGGYPISIPEYFHWSQVPSQGVSHPGLDGVYPVRTGWRYPPTGLPHWDWMVYPPPGLDGGAPLGLDRVPPIRTEWGFPRLGLDGTWAGYAADGVPLAVSRRRTFFVLKMFSNSLQEDK